MLPVEVLGELGLFLVSLVFLILTFASSLSALEHGSWAFSGLPRAALSLWELSLGMISSNQLESLGQGAQTEWLEMSPFLGEEGAEDQNICLTQGLLCRDIVSLTRKATADKES